MFFWILSIFLPNSLSEVSYLISTTSPSYGGPSYVLRAIPYSSPVLFCSEDTNLCSLHFPGSHVSWLLSWVQPMTVTGMRLEGRRKGEARTFMLLCLCLKQINHLVVPVPSGKTWPMSPTGYDQVPGLCPPFVLPALVAVVACADVNPWIASLYQSGGTDGIVDQGNVKKI